jgi:cytochrome c peroxidase
MRRLVLGVMLAAAAGCVGAAGGPRRAAAPALPGERLQSGTVTIELPVGLQAGAAYVPDDNPLSPEKIALGRLLYFDKRLSKDDTVSCATCHDPAHAWAEPRATSIGVGGKVGARNAPTVINRLFSKEQFWDGRGADLEAQAGGPLVNPIEMAMPSHAAVERKVRGIAGYPPRFAAAFGTPDVTIGRLGQAIASFERTVVAGNSPFDRHQAGDKTAMTDAAVRGMAVFNGKGNCVTCHAGFNFTDESYHNLGVGMLDTKPDPGRVAVTKARSETGAFKTPTLRNVAQSAPYMHDGSEATLADVIDYYDRGGNKNRYLAKEMRPLGLTSGEKADLVAFLEALDGDVTPVVVPTEFP